MPLKIAIDVRHLRDFGIGTYIRSLVPALAALDRANQYVLTGFASDFATLPHLPDNFTTAAYQRKDDTYLDHLAYPSFLRGLELDLCHVPVNRVPVFMPKPYIVTLHDMSSLIFASEKSTLRSRMHRFRFRRGLARAERVIAVSAATRRDAENLLSIPAERIRLVYNAPNPQFFAHGLAADARNARLEGVARERQRLLERYQVTYPFLLYAGKISPQKNIPRLVEAFAVARDALASHPRYRDLRLIVIGDEISRYPSVRRAVLESRVEQAVRFLGFVPFDTLRIFYETAEIFVFPSLYEGFGLPPLEAMACGTPVITSSVSSLPEVVDDAAVLVNPENVFDIARAIQELLLDQGMRERLRVRGLEHASRYSWERNAREVLNIYREVAENREDLRPSAP